jgi:hypothetical protein
MQSQAPAQRTSSGVGTLGVSAVALLLSALTPLFPVGLVLALWVLVVSVPRRHASLFYRAAIVLASLAVIMVAYYLLFAMPWSMRIDAARITVQ